MKKYFSFLSLLSLTTVHAEDRIVCTEITSTNIEMVMSGEKYKIVFTDNVCVSSDDFNLKSENVDVFCDNSLQSNGQKNSKIKHIVATKHARFVQKYRCGEADKIVVHVREKFIEMFGNAKVSDRDGTIVGEYLTIDNRTRVLRMNKINDSPERSKVFIQRGAIAPREELKEQCVDEIVPKNVPSKDYYNDQDARDIWKKK